MLFDTVRLLSDTVIAHCRIGYTCLTRCPQRRWCIYVGIAVILCGLYPQEGYAGEPEISNKSLKILRHQVIEVSQSEHSAIEDMRQRYAALGLPDPYQS